MLESLFDRLRIDVAQEQARLEACLAKIETDPAHPELIVTVWGVGYKYNDAAHPASR